MDACFEFLLYLSSIYYIVKTLENRISGVMVNVLILSMLDRGFCQVTPKTIKLVFAVSPLSTQEKEQILVGSESEKCVPTDCCFSEQAL